MVIKVIMLNNAVFSVNSQLGSYALPGKSCADILQNVGDTKSLSNGEYWIKVDTAGPMRVYCDMKTKKGRLNTILHNRIPFHILQLSKYNTVTNT
jgi:hypothetical protein